MNVRDHLIVGRHDDLLLGPLQQFLAGRSDNATLGASFAAASASTTDVWFADHLTFLICGTDDPSRPIRRHVILRIDDAEGIDNLNLGLAVKLAARFAQLKLRFWTLNTDAARQLSDVLGVEVAVLCDGPARNDDRPPLHLNPTTGVAQTTDGALVSIRQTNLARLARRYSIQPSNDVSTDGHHIAALANTSVQRSGTASSLVLFILPHGVGLGHVSRCLAIAQQMQDIKCEFLVYSASAYLIAQSGYAVTHRPSAITLDADPDVWRAYERAELRHYIATRSPAAVIVDAGAIDPFIADVMTDPVATDTALIWIRRQMWRKDRARISNATAQICDAIVVPDELADDQSAQTSGAAGGLAQMISVPPITLEAAALPRAKARKSLGLGRGRICLLNIGGWHDPTHQPQIAALQDAAKRNGIKLVSARSPLAGPVPQTMSTMPEITAYPLVRYLAAFDGVISAAGYNSFHELMLSYQGPVLFLPVDQRGLDDQGARASFAATAGFAEVMDPADLDRSAEAFMRSIRSKQQGARPGAKSNGALKTANALRKVTEDYNG